MNDLGYIRSARWVPHLLTDEQKRSRVRLASQVKEKYDKIYVTHVVWKRELQVMKPGSIVFNPILRLKIRFWFNLRVTDLSLHAVAKHQIACCL